MFTTISAVAVGPGGPSPIVDVASNIFTTTSVDTRVTVTLFGGAFAAGPFTASNFTLTGANADALALGTFTRINDTKVTITGLTLAVATNNLVMVNSATQALATSGVTAVADDCPTFFAGRGLGTSVSPYLVSSPADLGKIGACLGSSFQQTTHITLLTAWTPIGTSVAPFTGTYDGNGFNISGLAISQPTTDNVGLFGYISGATLTGINITGDNVAGRMNVGGIVGSSDSRSTVTDSSSNVNVTGIINVGGLIGSNNGSTVSDSQATGSASVTYSFGAGTTVGGLIGLDDHGTVTDSFATGSVTGGGQVGGLIGEANGTEIFSSYATGTTNLNKFISDSFYRAGGLIGLAEGVDVSYSHATGDVVGAVVVPPSPGAHSGATFVGGLIGALQSNSVLYSSYATGSATGYSKVGGLIGSISGGSVSSSYATGNATADFNYVGGLAGSVTGTEFNDIYATGAVTGEWQVGGLFGEFSLSTISGEDPPSYLGSLTNGYANGRVNASGGSVGGVMGQVSSEIIDVYHDNFWDTQTSLQGMAATRTPVTRGLMGKTTSQMKSLSNYVVPPTTVSWSIASGFDTSKTWGLCPDVNDGYPFLTVFYVTNPCAGITPSPEPGPGPAPAGDPTPLVTPGPVNIVAVSAEQGVREVPGRTVAPGIVVVSNELASGVAPKQASTPAGPGVKNAPVIQSRLGEIVRVSVNGLGNSRALNVAIQTADGWVKIGETKTDVNGAAILPALSSILAGDVLIRTKGPRGKLRYVIVRFS